MLRAVLRWNRCLSTQLTFGLASFHRFSPTVLGLKWSNEPTAVKPIEWALDRMTSFFLFWLKLRRPVHLFSLLINWFEPYAQPAYEMRTAQLCDRPNQLQINWHKVVEMRWIHWNKSDLIVRSTTQSEMRWVEIDCTTAVWAAKRKNQRKINGGVSTQLPKQAWSSFVPFHSLRALG